MFCCSWCLQIMCLVLCILCSLFYLLFFSLTPSLRVYSIKTLIIYFHQSFVFVFYTSPLSHFSLFITPNPLLFHFILIFSALTCNFPMLHFHWNINNASISIYLYICTQYIKQQIDAYSWYKFSTEQETVFFNSSSVSKADSQSPLNQLDPDDMEDDLPKADPAVFNRYGK